MTHTQVTGPEDPYRCYVEPELYSEYYPPWERSPQHIVHLNYPNSDNICIFILEPWGVRSKRWPGIKRRSPLGKMLKDVETWLAAIEGMP